MECLYLANSQFQTDYKGGGTFVFTVRDPLLPRPAKPWADDNQQNFLHWTSTSSGVGTKKPKKLTVVHLREFQLHCLRAFDDGAQKSESPLLLERYSCCHLPFIWTFWKVVVAFQPLSTSIALELNLFLTNNCRASSVSPFSISWKSLKTHTLSRHPPTIFFINLFLQSLSSEWLKLSNLLTFLWHIFSRLGWKTFTIIHCIHSWAFVIKILRMLRSLTSGRPRPKSPFKGL